MEMRKDRTNLNVVFVRLSQFVSVLLPIVPPLFPAVRNGGDGEEVERKHDVPAEHGPLAIIQSQGFLERIFELNILERFLLLLWCQHNLCGPVRTNSGLHLLLLLGGFKSTF